MYGELYGAVFAEDVVRVQGKGRPPHRLTAAPLQGRGMKGGVHRIPFVGADLVSALHPYTGQTQGLPLRKSRALFSGG